MCFFNLHSVFLVNFYSLTWSTQPQPPSTRRPPWSARQEKVRQGHDVPLSSGAEERVVRLCGEFSYATYATVSKLCFFVFFGNTFEYHGILHVFGIYLFS